MPACSASFFFLSSSIFRFFSSSIFFLASSLALDASEAFFPLPPLAGVPGEGVFLDLGVDPVDRLAGLGLLVGVAGDTKDEESTLTA